MAKTRVFAGRYRYLKPLGRGAGGAVYLAEDLHHNLRKVALKVLSAEAFATVQGKMIKREFEILSKLSHPNLVAVYDYGALPDGGVFLAEEYIDGFSMQDARALVTPTELIDLTMQILQGLAYLHGMGMIHRDIKPANIMLLWLDDEDARPMAKVVDFGLSSADPKRDTLRGGTRSYMAPEIIRGEKGELRSDLYSLGVTLYYAMCGVLPFGPRTKEDPPTNEEPYRPPEPHRLNTEVPLAFSRFTMVLLRQLGDFEYADAGEALKALASDHESLEWILNSGDLDIAAPPVLRGYFEKGILLREEMQKATIVDNLKRDGRAGSLHLINGGEGVGKSRLMHEVTSSLKLRGSVVLSLACKKEPDAFQLLINMLTELMAVAESRDVVDFAEFRSKLNMLKRLSPWIGHQRNSTERELEFSWIRAAIEHLVSEMGPDRVVLMIEDIHLTDEISIDFLSSWFKDSTIKVRPSIVATALIGHDTDALIANEGVHLVEVEGLRLEDANHFFHERLGVNDVPDEWIQELTRLSGANPSYVEEICRHFIHDGTLSRASSIQWTVDVKKLKSFQLPKGQSESLRRRLNGLGTLGREVLEILAVIDERLEWSVLRKLLMAGGETLENAERTIELLILRHFLDFDLEQSGRYLRLIHPQLGRVIRARLNAGWEKSLHRRIGDRFRKNWLSGKRKAIDAAHHLTLGGDATRANVLLEVAGDDAMNVSHFEEAMICYTQAMEGVEDEPAIALLGSKLATAALRGMEFETSKNVLEMAWSSAERTALEWVMYRVSVAAVDVFLIADKPTEARVWLERLGDVAPTLKNSGEVQAVEARLLTQQGNLREARGKLNSAIAQSRHYGENGLVLWSLGLLGRVEMWDGNHETALALFVDAISLGDKSESYGALGWAMCGLGALQRRMGQYEQSSKTLLEAFDFVSEHSSIDVWIETLLEIVETKMVLGLEDEARARLSEARRLSENLGHDLYLFRADALSAKYSKEALQATSEKANWAIDRTFGFPHNAFAIQILIDQFEQQSDDRAGELKKSLKRRFPEFRKE